MLKKLKEYIPNIPFMSGMSPSQKLMLTIMVSISKESEEVFIDVDTFANWLELSVRTIKDVRKSLVDDGFIFLQRRGKNNRYIYGINKQKLHDSMRQHSVKNDSEEVALKADSSSAKIALQSCGSSAKTAPASHERGANFALHNVDNILTRNNVNNVDSRSVPEDMILTKNGSVIFYKINEFKNMPLQLISALTYLKENDLLRGESAHRDIADLSVDLQYHVNHRSANLSEVGSSNAALKLLQNGDWSRPKGLREQLEQESIAREQQAKKWKEDEWKDLNQGIRSSYAMANKEFQNMQKMLQGVKTA